MVPHSGAPPPAKWSASPPRKRRANVCPRLKGRFDTISNVYSEGGSRICRNQSVYLVDRTLKLKPTNLFPENLALALA
jgi:hypothetical protein